MAVRPRRSRSTIKTAAVLFLPAACVLAVWYATYKQPPESRQPNELAPSQLGQGFAPHIDLSTPAVAGVDGRRGSVQVPESLEHGSQFDALEARRLVPQPWMPPERRSLR